MDEQSLPIDIQLKKLLDWLVSRRICNRQWHEGIVEIREKIGNAMQDMPENDKMRQLLSGANINYFHCLRIVDILKDTEKDTKNFFGSYGSQRMKDWQEVLRLYQRDNAYLAEAAQLLSQSVTYEIPGLKKQLAKSIQVQEECDKKEKDNDRKAREFRAEFDKQCKQLGIKGEKIRKEIVSLLADLPETYAKIAGDCKDLKKARDLYCNFLKSTLEKEFFKESEVLPTLGFLMEKGNVTTYEWVHGEPPLSIEEPRLQLEENEDEEEGKGEATIDFGVDDDVGGGIDFSSVDVDLGSGTDIDWGNLSAAGTEDAVVTEIDWGTGGGGEAVTAGFVVEDGGVSGGVARDSDALSLLDNRRTRMLVLDELAELACFLEQRLTELQAEEEGSYSISTNVMQLENSDSISKSIGQVSSLESRLNTGKIHHLQLIRNSPKYVDRMVDSLRLKLALVDKMGASSKAVAERRDSSIEEQAVLQRKLETIKGKTKELQKEIERDISERYKKRPVNIQVQTL